MASEPVFPQWSTGFFEDPGEEPVLVHHSGIAFRDYLAARALATLDAVSYREDRLVTQWPPKWAQQMAKDAYLIADAMLAEGGYE